MPFGVNRRDAPPWEGLLRGLGVVFVFMGVVWLFWKHNAQTLEMIEIQQVKSQQVVVDSTQTLTQEQIKAIRDLGRALKSAYGLELSVRIDNQPIVGPGPEQHMVFFGLYPAGRQAVIILPPLAERAVGQGLADHLRSQHFAPYWQSGDWPRGLGQALGLLWDHLDAPSGRSVPLPGREYRGIVGTDH